MLDGTLTLVEILKQVMVPFSDIYGAYDKSSGVDFFGLAAVSGTYSGWLQTARKNAIDLEFRSEMLAAGEEHFRFADL